MTLSDARTNFTRLLGALRDTGADPRLVSDIERAGQRWAAESYDTGYDHGLREGGVEARANAL